MLAELPPELISHIISFWNPADADTIRNLLNLTSISRSFAGIALQNSLWIPITTETWSHGPLRTEKEDGHEYVRSRALLDLQARKSLNAMIQSSSGNLQRAEVIRIMGSHVIDRLKSDRDVRDPENGLTRYDLDLVR